MSRCAHDVCEFPATARIRAFNSDYGPFIRVCSFHYEFHITEGAKRRASEMGLDTIAKQKDYIRRTLKIAFEEKAA